MSVTAVIDIRVRGQKELTKLQKQTKLIRSLIDGIKPVPSLFDRTQIGMTKGLGEEIDKLQKGLKDLATGAKTFRGTSASLNRQLNTTRDLLGNLARGGKEWRNTLVAVERAQVAVAKAEQATMTQRMKSLSSGGNALGRDIVGTTLAQSSKIAQSRDALSAYREELSRLFNAVEIGSKHYVQLEAAIKKVDEQLAKPKPKKEVIGGIVGREKELKKALDLQNKLDSSSVGYKDAVLGVRKAQEAYNLELTRSIRQQRLVNAGVIAQKAAISGVIGLLKNIPRGIGDIGKLLGGGFGKPAALLGGTAGAAGIIAVSRKIGEIIQQLPLLKQGWKDNIEVTAKYVAGATEGISSIILAYTGLSTVLGGAQWVVGAVKGFMEFESAASKVIWSIEGNITRAFSLFGRLARELPSLASAIATVMPDTLGGLGVGGSAFDWMSEGSASGQVASALGGGAGRGEERRYRRQGPTQLQNAQQDLNQINKMLAQRNTTEKDYVALLKQQENAKSRISTLENEIKQKQLEAGSPIEQVYEKEVNAADAAIKKIDKLRKQSVQNAINANDQINKQDKEAFLRKFQAEKQLADEKKKKIQEVMAADARAHKKALDMEKQRRKARRDRMGRLGENLMLGAGFPMLFGGGAGAVAGGTVGALAQSAMGSGGFGAQILLSALGQQFDAFAKKTSELGQAFTALNKDTTPFIEALGKTGTEFEAQIKALEQLGESEKAFALARDKMVQLVGQDGVNSLSQYGETTKQLSSIWNQFMAQMSAGLAGLINSSGVLKSIVESLNRVVTLNRARGMAESNPAIAEVLKEMDDKSKDQGKYRPWDRGTGGRKDQGESRVNYEIRVSRQKTNEQLNDELIALVKKSDLITAQAEGIKLENALRAAGTKSLDEEIAHLERSLKIGSKAAEQEKEAAQIYKEQKDLLKNKLTLEEKDFLKLIQKRDALQEQLELWKQIKDTIATGLTSAIEGLIAGTKSLGESLASIARSIGSMLIQAGISSWIGGMNFGGKVPGKMPASTVTVAQGGYMANGIKPFASGGLATRPTLGLVGEAGEDEYIIPASKMAASMQRYSAGARGEAVIPGTGSSYAGSGGSSTTVNYSGPILNFNSEEFVPKSAVGQIIATATSQGARAGESKTLSTLRNSRSTRSRLGM